MLYVKLRVSFIIKLQVKVKYHSVTNIKLLSIFILYLNSILVRDCTVPIFIIYHINDFIRALWIVNEFIDKRKGKSTFNQMITSISNFIFTQVLNNSNKSSNMHESLSEER